MRRIRYFNKYVTNPIMKTFAGRKVYSVVHHVGRKSGREYQTPVLAMPKEDCFVIPLPYGADTDWCQNVIAAQGCRIEWQSETYGVDSPEIIQPEEALPFFPGWVQRMLRRTEQYLQVRKIPARYGSISWQGS